METISANRPHQQLASIARQLTELSRFASTRRQGFEPDQPASIGVAGGRLRIAFMHPDMIRFNGPAWQMPMGPANAQGDEQIVMLVQSTTDRSIHFDSVVSKYREPLTALPGDSEFMYPGAEIDNIHRYEQFGLSMSGQILLELDDSDSRGAISSSTAEPAVQSTRCNGAGNLIRPFTLLANAIASLRTVTGGVLADQIQRKLGQSGFSGLRILSVGQIPEGGFASSSAFTVAFLNALRCLYQLQLDDDTLIEVACQAEYGTGVRAGPLDHTTLQKGTAGIGGLISSNPAQRFRTLGEFSFPSEQIDLFFPYSVRRDSEAHRWSWGMYAAAATANGLPTAAEMRALTGKAAELAALLLRVPSKQSLFEPIEPDLLANGRLGAESRSWVCSLLRDIPLLIDKQTLTDRVEQNSDWLSDQLIEQAQQPPQGQPRDLTWSEAQTKARQVIHTLFAGWREPLLRRGIASGESEQGVPLRAMIAYLFAEVEKNFQLIHQPDCWIETVALSQRGDRSVEIAADRLPDRQRLQQEQPWERPLKGPDRLNAWLQRIAATPFDYNQGLSDQELGNSERFDLRCLQGSNFFRGLALIDFAEAMLNRAFGEQAVAVRVNGAGQGGYFQVHVNKEMASADEVQAFLRAAFYRRFDLSAMLQFVETHPGGGAIGLGLSRYSELDRLAGAVASAARGNAG